MSEQETSKEMHRECFCMGAGPHLSAMFRTCVSEKTREHFRNSRIEFLKGLRTFIDQRIEHLSRSETKGKTVPVE